MKFAMISIIDNGKKNKNYNGACPSISKYLSNVPGYDKKPIFHGCNNPEELIDNFIKTLYDIAQKSKNILLEKYNYIFERLEENEAELMKNCCL